MNLGCLVTTAGVGPKNLVHIVFEDGVYFTTGSQPIPGAGKFNLREVAHGSGIEESYEFEVVARTADNLFELRSLSADSIAAVASRIGHVPLPPYIARADEPADRERYQTVFARVPGAVAAPTAALHFDHDLIAALRHCPA